MRRTGVSSPEKAVAIARQLADVSSLRFAGLMLYPGHVRQHVDAQGEGLAQLGRDIARYTEALTDAGLPPAVVSGGSTPAAWRMHEVRRILASEK